jgi:hypothetical protein
LSPAVQQAGTREYIIEVFMIVEGLNILEEREQHASQPARPLNDVGPTATTGEKSSLLYLNNVVVELTL